MAQPTVTTQQQPVATARPYPFGNPMFTLPKQKRVSDKWGKHSEMVAEFSVPIPSSGLSLIGSIWEKDVAEDADGVNKECQISLGIGGAKDRICKSSDQDPLVDQHLDRLKLSLSTRFVEWSKKIGLFEAKTVTAATALPTLVRRVSKAPVLAAAPPA